MFSTSSCSYKLFKSLLPQCFLNPEETGHRGRTGPVQLEALGTGSIKGRGAMLYFIQTESTLPVVVFLCADSWGPERGLYDQCGGHGGCVLQAL